MFGNLQQSHYLRQMGKNNYKGCVSDAKFYLADCKRKWKGDPSFDCKGDYKEAMKVCKQRKKLHPDELGRTYG